MPFLPNMRRRPRTGASARHLIWQRAISLGPLGPVELRLHLGWVPAFLFTTWIVATVVLPAFFPGWHASEYWLVALGLAIAETMAGLLHELGHACVALAHGRQVH